MKKLFSLSCNCNGGILVLYLSLLPLLLATLFALSLGLHWIYFKMQIQKECFHKTWQGQILAGRQLTSLLQLNSPARALRIEQKVLEARLVIALVGLPETLPQVTELEKSIRDIQTQRHRIDQQQKLILMTSRYQMNSSAQAAVLKINQNFKEFESSRSWLNILAQAKSVPSTGLAVLPEDSDLAPVYKLENDFQAKQALDIIWKAKLSAKHPYDLFVTNSIDWKQKCRTTLEFQNEKFQVKINEDKF